MTRPRSVTRLGWVGLALLVGAVRAGSANASDVYSPKMQAQPRPLRVEVIDATHFRDLETQAIYRLYGVDACVSDQMAHLGRQPWPCGIMATAWLVTVTLDKWLACVSVRDDGAEHLVRCAAAGHADLAADMLLDGVAVLSPPTSGDPGIAAYAKAQEDARKAYRGLWSSTFEMPWDWRARHPHHGETAARDEANP